MVTLCIYKHVCITAHYEKDGWAIMVFSTAAEVYDALRLTLRSDDDSQAVIRQIRCECYIHRVC